VTVKVVAPSIGSVGFLSRGGWGQGCWYCPYKGQTALHCAAKAGFVQVATALIEYGADVNALNAQGRTPLDEVEYAGRSVDREPMRRLLIAHSARRSKTEAGSSSA
jgi:hypothetical protein